MRRWHTHLIVLAALAALTALMTYPIVLHAGHAVTDPGDPLLNTWILAWDVEQLVNGTIGTFFEANIFYPHARTLAYSEHLFPQALFALPIIVLTANPVLAYNIVLLLGFVTSGLGMYLLARQLTGDAPASFVAALVFAFSPFMFAHLPHMQIITAGGIPLAFLFLHRFFCSVSWRDAFLFALFFTVQILANGYYALFLSFFVAVFVTYHTVRDARWRSRRLWLRLATAGLLSALVASPFFYQYRAFQKEMGFSRGIGSRARLTSFLAASGENRLWTPLTAKFRRGESSLFPGAVALLLACGGLLACRSRAKESSGPLRKPLLVLTGGRLIAGASVALAALTLAALARETGTLPLDLGAVTANQILAALAGVLLVAFVIERVLGRQDLPRSSWLNEPARFYVLVLALAFLFTFGREGPYELLYRFVPGFDGIRAVSRWHVFVMLALAVLAACGFKALRARMSGRWRAATAILPGLLLAEYAAFPVSLDPVPSRDELPEVYQWITSNTAARDALLELPLPAPDQPTCRLECPRVYASAFHRRPIVNGFSGFIPPLYRELQRRWSELSVASNLADARALGVRYLVVHDDGWRGDARARLDEAILDQGTQLRLLARLSEATVYELAREGRPGQANGVAKPGRRLSPQGWSVRASVRDDLAALAIDGSMTTRWASGPQKKNTTFTLDLGRDQSISGLRLRLGSSRSDYPRGYRVELSRDALGWQLVAQDARAIIPITAYLQPTDLSLDVFLPVSDCRYIRIANLEDEPVYYWSIHEIEVLEASAEMAP